MKMHDSDREKFLKELLGLDFFLAEISLENDQIAKYMNKLVSLELTDGQLALDYAETRGKILALQDLQVIRKRIAENHTPSSKA